MNTATLKLKIISDAKDAQAGLDGVEKKTGKWAKGLKVAGGTALVAGGVVKVAYDQMIKPAGDLEQSIGAIDTVFKGNAKQMHTWAKGAATSAGLTRNEFNELGTLIGSQLKNGGMAMDKLGPQTNKLIGLGADLSSMFGGSTKEAVEALSSALKGEMDPIEKYGVSLSAAKIDAEAAALGFKKVGGAWDGQAKQAATLSLIMKQTGDAQGNFAKESDTLQGKQARLTAQFENAKAALGTQLLPVATKVFGFLADTALPAVTKLIDGFSGFGKATGGLGDLGTKLGIDKLTPMFTALKNVWMTVVETVLPILVQGFRTIAPTLLEVGRAVVGLVTAVAQRLVPVIRFLAPFVKQQFMAILNVVKPVLSFIAALIRTVTAVIKGDWSGAWNGIKDMFRAVWDLIKAIVKNAVGALKLALSTAWAGIKLAASAAWNGIKALIGKAWDGIKYLVTNRVTILKNIVSAVWNSIKSTTSTVWNAIKNGVVNAATALKNAVTSRIEYLKQQMMIRWELIKRTAVQAFETIKARVVAAVEALKSGVTQRIDLVKRTFTQLPGQITSALSGAANMLLQAGKNIVAGLINGIKSKIGEVKSTFTGLTKDIPNWKGPLATDKKLLKPAGSAIMGGLIKSINDERPALKRVLTKVSKDVAGTRITGPALRQVTGVRSTSSTSTRPAAAGGTVININMNGVVGDRQGIAREIEQLLAERGVVVGARAH
mgnify:CR=1 FL=1